MNIGWTTLASLEDARKMAEEMVSGRLAVCVQVEPITSYYLWNGSLESSEEYRLTVKFLAENTEKLEAWLNEHHPYDVPQWLAVPVDRVASSYKVGP